MNPSLFMLLAASVDPSALATCTTIDDDRQRLACYDSLLRPAGRASAAAVPSAPAPSAPAATVPAATGAAAGAAVAAAASAGAGVSAVPAPPAPVVKADPVDEFGLSAEQRIAKQEGRQPDEKKKKKEKPQELDSITARVAVVRQLRNDRFVLILENDQVWMQTEPTPRQRFYVGDEIEIRRASMGSFLATGPHTGGAIRVRRSE